MPKNTLLEKIRRFFTPNYHLRLLVKELVILQKEMQYNLGHIDNSQKEIIKSLQEVKACIADLKAFRKL